MEVMPTPDAGLAVDVVTAWRKNPLPTPLAVGIRIRALDGMGERHAARSRGKIPFVQGFDFVEVLLERLPHHTRQDRVAVFNFRKLKLSARSPVAVPRSISTTRRLDRGSELA